MRECMWGLYSHSRKYRKIFLGNYFWNMYSHLLKHVFPPLPPTYFVEINFGANTCGACIGARANTGKYSWRIIYVPPSQKQLQAKKKNIKNPRIWDFVSVEVRKRKRKKISRILIYLVSEACCCGLRMPNMIITKAKAKENLGEFICLSIAKAKAKWKSPDFHLQSFPCGWSWFRAIFNISSYTRWVFTYLDLFENPLQGPPRPTESQNPPATKKKFQKNRKPRLSPKVNVLSPKVNVLSPKVNVLSRQK